MNLKQNMAQVYDADVQPSPQEAENLVKRLSSGFSLSENSTPSLTPMDDKSLKIATFSLQRYLKEKDFATEFLERGGLASLCDIINNSTGNTLAYALNSFLSLMEHNTGWESLDDAFVAQIAHIVVNQPLSTIARPATGILEKLVCANEQSAAEGVESIDCFGYPTLHRAMKKEPELIKILVDRLLSPEYLLSTSSLSLLIAMLKNVTNEHRSKLTGAFEGSKMKKNVLRLMKNYPTDTLKLMILDYQTAYLQNICKRQTTSVSSHNAYHISMLKDIWGASKIDAILLPGLKKWKKIGFSTEVPQREFTRVGVFGLEEMHYFAMNEESLFSKLILEQTHRPEGKRCPFAKASIEVTDLLCSHWNVSSSNTPAVFQPLILDFDRVHSTTLQTFFRIFHDMEATTYDFSKVSALVRSQLRSALNDDAVKDIQEFDRNMFSTPYQVIRDRRLKELEWADDLLGRDAIREGVTYLYVSNLRTRLSKQSYEFLKKQRISCLLEGAWFPCPVLINRMSVIPNGNGTSSPSSSTMTSNSGLGINTSSMSGKRWRFYKLSTSKKTILFGDFAEKNPMLVRTMERLTNRIELSTVHEIKPIRRFSTSGFSHNTTTSTAPPTDLVNTTTTTTTTTAGANLSFALFNDKNTPLAEFHCTSAREAAEWKDGFSMLLDKRFTSKETAELFHALTEVGVKVKLLQIAGDRVEIPHGAIEIPPVPVGLGSGFFYDLVE
ncbi:ELMO/CED-12 family-domain-containing protein [Sporodiniella umbellata]|nr:ELMO/CED-12 family-domain-containing protein [Sporodiniella umbellata]